MGKIKEYIRKYVLPDGPFEWFFFSSLIIAMIVVILFLFGMYDQTQ